jgi:hypothetical protein
VGLRETGLEDADWGDLTKDRRDRNEPLGSKKCW